MNPQIAVELILPAGAALLLTRDVRRAWGDPLRRPVTLLMASLVTGWRMAPRRPESASLAWACGSLRWASAWSKAPARNS